MNKPLDPKVGYPPPGIDGSKIGSKDFSRPKDPVQCDPEANFLAMKKQHQWLSTWWQLKHFLCSTVPGEMIQFDEHIFQRG